MKELTTEYSTLAEELKALEAPEAKDKFEKDQRKRLEKFKQKYTVEATTEAKAIDWADVESKIFDPANIEANIKMNPEGWSLGYDYNTAMPGLGVSYYGGGGFTAFAIDKLDAERYVELEARKLKLKKLRKK